MTRRNNRKGINASSRKRGGPPVHVATTTAGANGANISIANPGISGDTVYILIWASSVAAQTIAGFTKVSDIASGTIRYALFKRKLDGSEGANFTITNVTNTLAIASAYRGGVGDVDVVGICVNSTGTTLIATSLTSTKPGVLLAYFMRSATATVSTPPAGMTQLAYYSAASRSTATYELTPSPVGATGAKSLGWSAGGTAGASILIQIY